MKPAQLAPLAALRSAFVFAALTSVGGAQTPIWVRQFGSTFDDYARAAAPDGAGGVYVSGWGPNAGYSDAWLARHDSSGNPIWIRQVGTSNHDEAHAAATDGTGGVYVSGHTWGNLGGPNAGNADVWLARFDSAGNQTWIRQLGTINDDRAFAAAPDGSGGVYFSGDTGGNFAGQQGGQGSVWLARYDSAGNQAWIRQFGGLSWSSAAAAASDGAGGVYLSGLTHGGLGGPNVGNADAWLARYDGAGNQIWVRQVGTPDEDIASAAAADGTGGVYISGHTNGSLGGPSVGSRDAWLARYDVAGNQIWIRQVGTPVDDLARAVVLTDAGGAYLSGLTRGSLGGANAGSYDAWVARYDAAGHQTWIRQFGGFNFDSADAASTDGLGGMYVCGESRNNLGGPIVGTGIVWLARYDGAIVTTRYCSPAVSNSTGQHGVLTALGSNEVLANNVTLVASQLPLNSFGFFLTSRDQGSMFPVSNSQGRLCLGGFIGRYVGPGQVKNSSLTGSFTLVLDLMAMAHPFSPVSVQPGQTWNFQAWHRDANPASTSNFTDALSATFL